MRLLHLDESSGNISLVEKYGDIPPYAILSHTWGDDRDEVTFKDMVKQKGANKPCYRKIEFCMERVKNDGLEYFWIDTCCIDKSSSAELTEAINYMFRWYQNAAKCYVYLADVSTVAWEEPEADDNGLSELRRRVLQQSRWVH
ncbi:HET-domain-containing protein [Bimuria novae-zelandiae CBS 107.79]|uniref:HET-domain-containing protein n=1 Tax=Bimuria novae-zelandiae CBS 107.79 TaxID=1447943 RepID=A0A6A5V8R5_9PLEO|nr:HET-domain-containing protein [Bimuria novae-zelandiae CBS 107.79]